MCFSLHSPSNDKQAARERTASRLSSAPHRLQTEVMPFEKQLSMSHWLLPRQRATKGLQELLQLYLCSWTISLQGIELTCHLNKWEQEGRKHFPIFSVTVLSRTLFEITVKLWLLNKWRKKECRAEKRHFSQNDLNEWNKIGHNFITVDRRWMHGISLYYFIHFFIFKVFYNKKFLIILYLYNFPVFQTK